MLIFISCNDDLPTACFDINYSIIEVDQEIYLSNCSENADNYLWDFGNDSVTTTKSPIISYDEAGTYTITLTAFKDKQQNIAFYDITVID